MCLLSVNKEGHHIQKFQNSFLSLENMYLLRTSSRSLTWFSLCHWPPLSQNRGDFWAAASVIFCIWQVWQSGCPYHMEKLTEWPFNNMPGKPIEGTRSVTQKINCRVREQKRLLSLTQTILPVSEILPTCLSPGGDMLRYK